MFLFSSIFLMMSMVGLSIGFFDHDPNHHEGWWHDSHEGGSSDSGEWSGPSHEFHHYHGGYPDSGESNGPPYDFHHNHGGFPESGGNNGHIPDNKNNTYEDILQKFILADEALKNFCANNSKVKPTITYGRTAYLLKYALTATDVNVDVKITNKILKTSVTLRDSQNTEVFTDVLVLPDILNSNGANWLISNSELKISIPYTVPLMTEISAECGAVNNSVITVPVAPSPTFEYRVNADTT